MIHCSIAIHNINVQTQSIDGATHRVRFPLRQGTFSVQVCMMSWHHRRCTICPFIPAPFAARITSLPPTYIKNAFNLQNSGQDDHTFHRDCDSPRPLQAGVFAPWFYSRYSKKKVTHGTLWKPMNFPRAILLMGSQRGPMESHRQGHERPW